ncbi:MAG TPA: hypothetical protein VJU61_20965 [Polyangiaceae bacterium]|nr:hypothetical protein [Polyangiaceae bacterium]
MRTPIQQIAPPAPVQVLAWVLALCAGFFASGCEVDERQVGLGRLQPDATVSAGCGVECPEVVCPADDVCKDYAPVLPRGTCGPGGTACASAADCSFAWKPEARDGAACACDAAGCKLLAGQACTRSDVCQSGLCGATDEGDNVCCLADCGPHQVCSPDGSSCAAATPCTEDARRCSGAIYQACSEGVWEPVTDCGALGCSKDRGGCLRSAGQACEVDADCGEGSCLAGVDGNHVCCTGACDTTCRRCAAAGTSCEDIDDDEACGPIACPSDEVCRSYDPPVVSTNRCRAGQCATAAEACTQFQPQRADLECSPTSLCDDQGNCSRPKKALLTTCSAGSECQSNACVATLGGSSVCCATACTANQICSATGSCVPAPVCDNDATQCSGSSFQRCSGGQWRTVLECGTLGCSTAREGCLGGAGDACNSNADCGAGSCQASSGGGSVCCTAACDGACRRCSPAGTTCDNLTDDAQCGTIGCPPDTTCRDFPAGVTSQRCVGGRCGSAAQLCVGVPRGNGQVCSNTSLCDGSGNCSVPKKALGEACTTGPECAQGNCVSGVCCSSACSGVCSTCSGTGGVCRAPATDTRCTSGVCSSPGVCEPPSVQCGSESCPITGAVCCSELSAAGETRVFCQRGTETCPEPPNFVPDIPINCDQNADCPTNRVCCMAGTSTSTEVSCKLPQPSPGTDETSIDFESCAPLNPMLFGNQLCQSPRGTFQCPAFESCDSTSDRLPGFAFCR